MSNTVRRVNQSEMTTFMRCPRKWTLGYRQGLTASSESPKLSLGTLVHAAMKEHYRGGDAMSYLEDNAPAIPGEEQTPEWDLAWLMVEGYLEWLEETGADVGHEIIVCEEELEVPLGPIFISTGGGGGFETDVVLHGTPDLLSRTPDGLLSLWDHKTVAAFGALADRRLQLNFQLLTYSWMWWRLKGERPDAVTLNMLRKVKRTSSAKPPFYARETVQFNQAQLESHERSMIQVAREMLHAEYVLDRDYPVPDSDCSWKCDFLPVCAMMDSHPEGAREMLNELYVKKETR